MEKPKGVTEEHLVYLDELRESGVTNMWGAASYVEREFCIDGESAKDILFYWMKTFSERHP
jgi:hypothetical protein